MSRRTQDRGPCGDSRFAYGALTLSGGPFQALPLRSSFVTARGRPQSASYNPADVATGGLGSPPFARRYSGGLA